MAYDRLVFKDMKIGDKKAGYSLLVAMEEKTSSKGNIYCAIKLSDGFQTVNVNIWDHTIQSMNVSVNTVIGIEIEVGEYMSNKTYSSRKIGPANNTTLSVKDFVEKAPLDEEMMFEEIISMVNSSVTGDNANTLAGLMENIYRENREKMLYWSAAENIHHNMYGGLLYHTYRMMKQAVVLSEVYPSLNKEVLFSATALHDIGKLKELSTSETGAATYTVDGQLFGHAYIGMTMVDSEAKKGNYDEEKIKCLKHCIASHHGKLEWGAIQLPRIEEASVLHYIDMIDSRIQQYEKTSEGIEPGNVSGKVFGLDNVKIYKPNFNE